MEDVLRTRVHSQTLPGVVGHCLNSARTNHFIVDPPGCEQGCLVTGVTRSIDGDSGGYDSIHPQGCAKNVLTVGAVSNLVNGYLGTVLYGDRRYYKSEFRIHREIRGTKEYPDGQEVYLLDFKKPLKLRRSRESLQRSRTNSGTARGRR